MPYDDDPLMVKIREQAEEIRYITGHTDTYPVEAFSKAQLYAMLSAVRDRADAIIGRTGVANPAAHYELVVDRLIDDPSAADMQWKPYEED